MRPESPGKYTEEKDYVFMRMALEEAEKAALQGEVPVGAVVVRQGQVIARAHNLRETNRNAVAHAELLAIDAACQKAGGWRLTDTTLYVTLEPCPMCAGAIMQARIDRVVFGAADPKTGACGSLMNLLQDNRMNHQSEVVPGVMAEESAQVLMRFFLRLRSGKAEKNGNNPCQNDKPSL